MATAVDHLVNHIVVDRLYTLTETASYLRVSTATILREVQRGRLRGLKIQRQWRFLGGDIRRYLDAAATDKCTA